MLTSDDEFNHVAALAYLEIDAVATQQLANDVNAIMAFVEQLRGVDTTSVPPLLHPLDLHQRPRIDEIKELNCLKELTNMAPLFEDHLYLVPKVIDTRT